MFRRKKRGWLAPDAVSGGAPPTGALCEYFEGGNPMKKFLSLVLALVMTMSLVTVSAGAKEFKDDADVTYDEAVAVISEVGVVDGYEDGSFKPGNTLTRGAAAKIICNLILGPTTAAELRADTAPYKDVPVSNVFSGYIAYCAKEGIISGYADGSFRPAGTLTGYAFMKMLLGALGYDSNYEGYTGGNWSINVAKQAIGIGLNKGMVEEFNGVDFVTREEAALYAFNTLKATMVDYDQKITTNVNGVDVTISQGNAKPVTWTEGINEDGNIKDDGFVQFAEEFFPKLVRKDDSTKFEEPANTWVYDKSEIGTFERTDLIVETYTEGVSGRDVYDLLKAGVVKDNDFESYVDGAKGDVKKADLARSNEDDLKGTGNGVVTKVYLDTDKDLITIVSINTWLAQATGDYSESKEYAPIKVFTGKDQTASYNVDVEDVANVVDVKNDTFYQVNISYKNGTRGEVVVVAPVEVLEDSTVTKFSASGKGDGTGRVTKLTTGGEEYKNNVKAFYDSDVLNKYDENLLTDNTYNVYVDANGYFLGVELFEGTKNYVFITGYDRPTSNLSVKTADAAAIFLDGTMEQIKVNVKDTNSNIEDLAASEATKGYFDEWKAGGEYAHNRWYTYTKTEAGVYTLKPCARMTATDYTAETTLNTANLRVSDNVLVANRANVYGEDATVFLTVDLDEVDTTLNQPATKRAITDVTGVYTGVQEVDLEIDPGTAIEEAEVYTVYDSDYFIIGAIVVGEGKGSAANIAYIIDGAKSEEYKDGTYYWTFECVMDGTVQTLTAKSKYVDTIRALRSDKDGIVELRFDGEYVVNVKDVKDIYNEAHFDKSDATGKPTYVTSDFDVYDVKQANELSLQGRTLYVLNDQDDNGLALAKDAKAVVIQDENNKEDVKTEFTSVEAAKNYLADANTDKAGLQYKGRIIAALDSTGAATWVLFISDTKLTTGSQQDGSSQTPVNVPGVSWNDTLQQFEVRYYNPGNKMNDQQVRNYVIEKMEAYAGAPVKSYIGNLMTFADGSLFGTRVTVIAVQQNALKVNGGIVGYYDNGAAVGDAQIDALKLAEGRYIDNSKLSGSSKFVVDVNGNNSTRNSFANNVAGVDMELYTAYIVTDSTAGGKVSFTLNDTDKTAFTTGYLVADGQQIVVNFAVDTDAKDYTINNRLVRVGTTDAVKEIVTVDGAVTVKDVADYQTAADLQANISKGLTDAGYTEGTEKAVTNAKITWKGNTLNVVIDNGKTAGDVAGTGLLAGAAALINDGNTVTLTFANGEKMVIDAGAAANLAGLKAPLVGMIGHQAPTTAVTVTVTNTASGQSVNYTVNLSTASV